MEFMKVNWKQRKVRISQMEHTKKVLIIGKNSYIGRSFMQYCNMDSEQMTMNQSKVESLDVKAISGKDGEWRDTEFESYDTVILLSGIVHTTASEEQYEQVNHIMAVEIAKKAKASLVKQFIFMSTIAVYGDELEWSGNQIARNPMTPYAKSKQKAEDDIRKLEDDRFAVAIVQPPMVYGKDCPGNFTKLVRMIGTVHVFPKYFNRRSSIFILNLCEFLRGLIVQQCGGCFVPQNPQYLCSLDVAMALKEEGVAVFMIPGLSGIMKLAGTMNKKVKKAFGDYQFPMELSQFEQIEYQKYNVTDSLKLSL